MERIQEHFDMGALLVILITFFLFLAALFTQGAIHDLFLEAGVFLVAVKLIMMAHRESVVSKSIRRKLDRIEEALEGLDKPFIR